ncbi:hypothetical protein MESS2_440023 [Mesorhizobium metallidurans STM 2683]|uniref:Uncharacterized protein n=1 Tax=Mesorhizobium metallidurans STM 2683 TaxID=1297569 RepID=M5ESE4_9HYPH|nr:hypothetical protein MESS2_440023 [Mesorhizobium metallidurans STM 2683]
MAARRIDRDLHRALHHTVDAVGGIFLDEQMLAGGIAFDFATTEQQIELARIDARKARQIISVVRASKSHIDAPISVIAKVYGKTGAHQSPVFIHVTAPSKGMGSDTGASGIRSACIEGRLHARWEEPNAQTATVKCLGDQKPRQKSPPWAGCFPDHEFCCARPNRISTAPGYVCAKTCHGL